MAALYVVGTPIGNLGDLTPRAGEVLARADLVLAEDTRRTRGLLAHLGLAKKPLERLDAHATTRRVEGVVERLAEGASVALVTDAGMPGVSDPGAALVSAARARGIPVVPIPGPSAITAAVAASGLVAGPFVFLAFLPRSGKKRRLALERIARSQEPVVLFEAPARVASTLRDLAALAPSRPVALCRELTKVHEEILTGTLADLAALEREWLGEVTLVVAAGHPEVEEQPSVEQLDAEILLRIEKGTHPRDLATELARRLGIARRDAYQRVLALRGQNASRAVK